MADHSNEGWPDWEINSLRDRVADLEAEVDALDKENALLLERLEDALEYVDDLEAELLADDIYAYDERP